jgi:hypothetical protein
MSDISQPMPQHAHLETAECLRLGHWSTSLVEGSCAPPSYHQERQNTVCEQPIENNDPRYEKKLYLACTPDGEAWRTYQVFSRQKAQSMVQEGYAVIEYTRLGFLKESD